MKKISTIGYKIPGHDNLSIPFDSKNSLMDTDIIIITPDLPYYAPSAIDDGYYQGKRCYGEHSSFQLKEDISHWKKELKNCLQAGKVIFFLLSEKKEFFVDTGTRTHSGTGRNERTTIRVAPGHNYEILPLNIGTVTAARGTHIEFTGAEIFKKFFKIFKPCLTYQAYLEHAEGLSPVFTGKDKTKILGGVWQVGCGFFVALPYPSYEEEKFTEYRTNKKGEELAYWSKEAVKFGNNLVECLREIDEALTQGQARTPPPKWSFEEGFSTQKEKDLRVQISDNYTELEELQKKNEMLKAELLEEQKLKDLLFEQGKPLEIAVIRVLKLLGYSAENYNDGELELDQVIVSPEGYRYIGESEGKDEKDINITKLRQLLESLNADFAREEITEKAYGILFGNPQRLTSPEQRTLDFTAKCKKSAERERFALVKTADLFFVGKYLSEHNDDEYKKSCREAIFNGLGSVVKFPEAPNKKLDIKT